METGIHGDIDMRHGNMEEWRHGDIETWRHGQGDMGMETWVWRHGHGDKIKQETEAQAIFLHPFTVCSHANRSLLFFCLLTKKQPEGQRPKDKTELPINAYGLQTMQHYIVASADSLEELVIFVNIEFQKSFFPFSRNGSTFL